MTARSSETQYVTFALGSEVFAVPVAVVREILDHEEAFRIPNGPDYLVGLRDVRGQGVPVIDLRLKLGLSRTVPTPHTRVLVVDITLGERQLTLGLVADRVFEVVAFRGDRWRRRRTSASTGTRTISTASSDAIRASWSSSTSDGC